MSYVTHEELSSILSKYATKQDLEGYVTDTQFAHIFQAVKIVVKGALENGFSSKVNEMSVAFKSLQNYIKDELKDLRTAVKLNQLETEERLDFVSDLVYKLHRRFDPDEHANGKDERNPS